METVVGSERATTGGDGAGIEVSGFAGVGSLIFEGREESAADGDGAGVGESFSEVFSVEAVDGSCA